MTPERLAEMDALTEPSGLPTAETNAVLMRTRAAVAELLLELESVESELVILREQLDGSELELAAYRARVAKLETVYEAAKAWRLHRMRVVDAHGEPRSATGTALIDAVDAAVAP